MRRSLLLLLAIAALAAPSATLAADPTPVTIRSFVITGMVLGDQKYDVEGKMVLEGTKLSASVGCNSMGGDVTLDGATLTVDSLMTTEMACQGDLGLADVALAKILTGGTITMTADQWTNGAGTLFVMDAGLQPEPVPTGDPDVTVTSPPDDPAANVSLDDCVGILPADEFPSRIDGSSGSSGGSGSGSTGTGTTTTDPGTGGGTPGSEPKPVESASAVDGGPAPDATGQTDPAAPPPAASEQPIDLPMDPGVVVTEPTPVPGSTTPTLEQCRELVSRIRTLGAPQVSNDGTAGGAAETVSDKSAHEATPFVPFAATILVLGAVALVLLRRSRRSDEADAI